MIDDREIWAIAQVMLRRHGRRAAGEVARCIDELKREGEREDRVATWRRIGGAIEQWGIGVPGSEHQVH